MRHKFMLPARDLAGAALTINCLANVCDVFDMEHNIQETRANQSRPVHAPCSYSHMYVPDSLDVENDCQASNTLV